MREQSHSISGWSAWAAAAPVLCAIHCALTPLLLLFIPAFALSPAMELRLLGLSAAIALLSLVPAIRIHGQYRVLIPAVGGLLFWAASLAHLLPLSESLGSPIGAITLAGGIFWSSRLRHQVTCASCSLARKGRPSA